MEPGSSYVKFISFSLGKDKGGFGSWSKNLGVQNKARGIIAYEHVS